MPILQPAQSYYVTVYAPGAVVTTGATGTTFTVRPGHGFRPSDRFLRNPFTSDEFGVVDSCTSTTLTVSTSTTWSAGDVVVNLGVDTGTTAPEWDGSPISIHENPDYSDTKATLATVQANVQGEYDYFLRGDGRVWEVIRSTTGDVVDLYRGWGYDDRVNCADYGCEINGVKDDTLAWDAAIRAADGLGVPFYMPKGELVLDQPATITGSNMVVTGAHHALSKVLSTAEEGNAIHVDVNAIAGDVFELRDIAFHQHTNALNAGAKLVNIESVDNIRMDRVSVTSDPDSDLCGNGVAVAVDRFFWGSLNDVNIRGYGGSDDLPTRWWDIGFQIADTGGGLAVDSLTLRSCYASRCLNGVVVAENLGGHTNSNFRMEGCKIVLNGSAVPQDGGVGIKLYAGTMGGVSIENCLLEGYGDYGIWVRGANEVSINCCRITHNGFDANSAGIYVSNWTRGLSIQNCWISGSDPLVPAGRPAGPQYTLEHGILIDADAELDSFFMRGIRVGEVTNGFTNNMTTLAEQQEWFVTEPHNEDGTTSDFMKFYSEDIYIGKDRDSGINLYFQTASDLANLKWQVSPSSPDLTTRFEFNKGIRASGTIRSGAGSGIEGGVTGGWFPGLGLLKSQTGSVGPINGAGPFYTVNGFLPIGALILGVGVTVTTAIDVATALEIGDDSPSATRFGTLSTLTKGGAFDITEAQVQASGMRVQLTPTGGVPTVGQVQVTVYYFEVTAPSEDV